MINFSATFYRIEATCKTGSLDHKIAISYGRNPDEAKAALVKKYALDGRANEKAANLIGRIPSVVLSPDDMRIIAGDHTERRRFLDLLLSMLYPAYFSALQHYHRALKMRSQVLKSRPDEAVLVAVDRELSAAGVQILTNRRQFIPEFATPFTENVAKISGGKDSWQIQYRGDTEAVTTIEDYMALLKSRRANDLRLRQTTAGIHRDRIFFLADGHSDRDIRIVGSQGQKRTAALALKMAQFNYMRGKLNATPILLIDDILNELDLARRASFIDFLASGEPGQVFFTTTDLVGMQDELRNFEQLTGVQNIQL
jgi:DNA replication and repair protein RecF